VSATADRYPSERLVLLVVDLTNYTVLSRSRPDAAMAAFLDQFYALAEDAISGQGGRIVKFMGDAVLATFPPDAAPAALAATLDLRTRAERLAADSDLEMAVAANLHLGSVVVAEVGKGASRRPDVLGRVVVETFRMGNAAGLRLSDAFHRALPAEEQARWRPTTPP
jgi:adenylate cyclase